MAEKELRALIDLLDDNQVIEEVRSKLLEYGSEAIPYLIGVIQDEDPSRVHHAQQILKEIHRETFENEWKQMLTERAGRDLNLEESIWFISRLQYPGLDVEHYKNRLAGIADEVRARIRDHDSGIARLRRLIGVLVNDHKFNGNSDDYYDPDNSFLNKVLERKTGIPISLSVLYILVGQRVGIQLDGIGIPAHFMLKFKEESDSSIYYIDPFHRGRILDRAALKRFCLRLGVGFDEEFLKPQTHAEIVERMMRNLVMVYTKNDNDEMLIQLKNLLNIYVENYLE